MCALHYFETDKTAKRYSKYGEFVSDLRRVFSNAIKYNSAHLASDTTGITKLVYEAAQFLQEKLEGLLAPFTVHLADRIERARYKYTYMFQHLHAYSL